MSTRIRSVDPRIVIGMLAERMIAIIIELAQDEPDAIDGLNALANDMRNRIHKKFAERANGR